MSMFVPKSWLNIRILLAGFKQLLRQTWDHQNIHTYPPLDHLVRNDLSAVEEEYETLWVEINNHKAKVFFSIVYTGILQVMFPSS